MKRLLLILLCGFSCLWVSAQDTNQPFIMSPHAYDSVLRALKYADSLKKKQDTGSKKDDSFGPGLQHHGKDSADKVITPVKQQSLDSLIKNTPNSSSRDVSKDSNIATDSLSIDGKKTGLPDSSKVELIKITTGIPKKYGDIHGLVEIKDTVQKKPHKPRSGYVALQFGLALPVGDYANLGYAKGGNDIAIDVQVPGPKSRLEWAFKFAMGWNGVNTSAALQNDAIEIYSPGTQYSVNTPAHGYTWHTELVGPCFSIPGKKLSFDIKLLFGILSGTIPAMSFNAKDTLGHNITVNQYSATGHGFAFDFVLGVHYRFSHHITATLSFDYLTSKPSFSLPSAGITQTYDGIRLIPVQSFDIKQSFNSNLLNIGVGYSLGN